MVAKAERSRTNNNDDNNNITSHISHQIGSIAYRFSNQGELS